MTDEVVMDFNGLGWGEIEAWEGEERWRNWQATGEMFPDM